MQIELGHEVRSRLRRALRQAGRREIGGMLFAEQLSPAHFRVMEFSLDEHSGSQGSFTRDPDMHAQALEDFFRRTGHEFSRFNYLGEWHSHPSFSTHPSLEDIATMTDLVEESEGISFAVLMVVRLRFQLWMDYTLSVFVRGAPPMRPHTLGVLRLESLH